VRRQRDSRARRAAPLNEQLEGGEEDGDADRRRRAIRVREHNERPALLRVGVHQLHLSGRGARLRVEEREPSVAVEPVGLLRLGDDPPQVGVRRRDDALDHASDAVLRANGRQLARLGQVHAALLQQHRRAHRAHLRLEEREPHGLGDLRHEHKLELREHVGGGGVGEAQHCRRRPRRAARPRQLGCLLRQRIRARRQGPHQPVRRGRLRSLQHVPAEVAELEGQLGDGQLRARRDEGGKAPAPLVEGVGGGRVQARAVEEVVERPGGFLTRRDDVRLVGRREQRRAHQDRVRRQRDSRARRAAPLNEQLEGGEEDGDADRRRRAIRVREHNERPALLRVGVHQLHLSGRGARLRVEEREPSVAVEPVGLLRLGDDPPQVGVRRRDDALDHASDAVLRANGRQLARLGQVHAALLQQHRRAHRAHLRLEEREPHGLGDLRHEHKLELREHVGGGGVGEAQHCRRRPRRAARPRQLGCLLRQRIRARRQGPHQPVRRGRLRSLQHVPAEVAELEGQLGDGQLRARRDEGGKAPAPLVEGVGGGRVQARAVEEVELSGHQAGSHAGRGCTRASLRSPPRGLPRSRAAQSGADRRMRLGGWRVRGRAPEEKRRRGSARRTMCQPMVCRRRGVGSQSASLTARGHCRPRAPPNPPRPGQGASGPLSGTKRQGD